MQFTSKILHTPYLKPDVHNALRMPVYDSAAFDNSDCATLEEAFRGTKPAHVYSRLTNPTVEYFETVVKNATGAFSVIAVSSGMAAISNVLLSLLKSGDNIVTSTHLFSNTFSYLSQTLKSFQIETRFVDLTDLKALEKAVDKNTRIIYAEGISNPQLEVVDLKALSDIAHRNNSVFVLDSTMTPFIFFDSKKLGIDIEVISATKYISGGGTAVGGLIVEWGNFDWKNTGNLSDEYQRFNKFALVAKLRKEVYRNTGACLTPHSAYLLNVGLETLELRVSKSCSNALELAKFLSQHRKVLSVAYPGLPDSPYHQLANLQFNKLYGGIITIRLGSKENTYQFMDALKLFKRATNLNDNKSLVLNPANTIYTEYSPEVLASMDISHDMVRISVGIEDANDLIEDMTQALEKISL